MSDIVSVTQMIFIIQATLLTKWAGAGSLVQDQ